MIDLHSRGISAVIFSIVWQGFVLCHFIFVILLSGEVAAGSYLTEMDTITIPRVIVTFDRKELSAAFTAFQLHAILDQLVKL